MPVIGGPIPPPEAPDHVQADGIDRIVIGSIKPDPPATPGLRTIWIKTPPTPS